MILDVCLRSEYTSDICQHTRMNCASVINLNTEMLARTLKSLYNSKLCNAAWIIIVALKYGLK